MEWLRDELAASNKWGADERTKFLKTYDEERLLRAQLSTVQADSARLREAARAAVGMWDRFGRTPDDDPTPTEEYERDFDATLDTLRAALDSARGGTDNG